MNAPIQGTGNAPIQEAGIAPNQGAGIAPKPRGRHRSETKGPAMPRNQGAGIAPKPRAGIASISADDRSIVSAANAKNGKSQESSFFPATFRHSLFVKLYVFPSERNCCGSQSKCRCQRQYDPKPWLAAVAGLSGFIISSSFVGVTSIGGS